MASGIDWPMVSTSRSGDAPTPRIPPQSDPFVPIQSGFTILTPPTPTQSEPTDPSPTTAFTQSPTDASSSNTSSSSTSSSSGNTNGSSSGGLSSGAKAGIGVGVAIPVILIIIAVFFVWRRRRAAKEKNDVTGEADGGAPSMTKPNSDLSPKHAESIINVTGIAGAPGEAGNNKDAKVAGVASTDKPDLDSTSRENELDAVNNQRHELGNNPEATVRDAYELMSSQYYELDPSDRPARPDVPIAPQKIGSQNFENNAKPESENTGDGENEVYQAALDAIASEEERLRKRKAALLAHHKSGGDRTE